LAAAVAVERREFAGEFCRNSRNSNGRNKSVTAFPGAVERVSVRKVAAPVPNLADPVT
jgi:hypothetical protein